MAAPKYDVIVVGAGPGGCACAALPAKWGMKTLLLDKNDHVGGKSLNMHRDGFTYELWPIAQVPMRGDTFEAAFRELGVESELKPIALDVCSITYRGRSGEYKTAIMDQTTGQDPIPFFDLWELDAKEREDALQVLTEMVSLLPEKGDALDDITFDQFLASLRSA
ncbi:hypothetical protein ES703_94853 [subsurface metagenome]